METRTRIIVGISCYIIAIFLISLDREAIYSGMIFIAAGTRALFKEWATISILLWRAAVKRADKVAKERRCALCSAPPIYMLHLVAIDPALPVSPLAGKELHVCKAHHPNREIAPEADELHRLIKRIDKNLTYDRVYPYCFFET